MEEIQDRQAARREWKTLSDHIMALPESAAVAVAAGAAQRLMDEHLKLPEENRDAFILGWRPVLDLLWKLLSGASPDADKALRERMEQYFSGPYSYHLADKALPGSDENAAAAAIYAAEAYCNQSASSACAAAQRLVDAASQNADRLSDDPMSTEAKAMRIRFERGEIRRLGEAVAVLEGRGVTEGSLGELHAILARP
jgi:hypothetical protein